VNEITLYKKHVHGIGTWRIWSEGATIVIAHATVIGGSEVVHREQVEVNLSGRTLEQQIALRINSRVSRMMDKGYKTSRLEALNDQSNQLGLHRPMLAHPIDRVNSVDYRNAVLQKKLDGHRCLITVDEGKPVAYSRQGKYIPAIKHILNALTGRLPQDITLDGELYVHGVKLQTIGSWIKREQPDTLKLSYVVYDIISPDRYIDRHAELSAILKGVSTEHPGEIMALPYRLWTSHEDTTKWFREVRAQGFEGLMLRLDGRPYEIGRRSSGLLKIKEFDQAEFEVVGFKRSSTGWAICECLAPNGSKFDCSAPGSVAEKTEVWENQAKYLGRKLTVDFAHWTDDGIPFQPTALRWRDDI
jgi:hypothetical protein